MTELRGPSAGNGSTGDLIDFLRARLADDERVAPLAAEVMALRPSTAGFGARLLREVDAKRRILDLHPHMRFATLPEEWPESWRAEIKPAFPGTKQPYVGCERCDFNSNYEVVEPDWWCEHVRLLALPYPDHPDYRPEWAT